MYPFDGLPENLTAFCRELRETRGFLAGPGETLEAARALTLVDLGDERQVRNTLRPILSSSLAEARQFDGAFTAFFLSRSRGVSQAEHPSAMTRGATRDDITSSRTVAASIVDSRDSRTLESDLTDADAASVDALSDPMDAADSDEAAGLLRSRSSPIDVDTAAGPHLGPVPAAWRAAARSLVRRLHFGASRRWRPGRRGRRFDLRRTLRASLQTGGEPLSPRWLRRRWRPPRLVLLVDGSRSMSAYWQASLELAVALAAATPRIEVFAFSTTVERVTSEVRSAASGDSRKLAGLRTAWGGGTSIGASVAALLRSARPLLGPDAVVIIVSDGLDVGRPDALRDAVRELQRRSAMLIWSNPLAGTTGYQPTAAAMRAARPFISTFACVTTPVELTRLSRALRL
jgi:uncharacterized protein with von Willebrand factor type A (vWA) domain